MERTRCKSLTQENRKQDVRSDPPPRECYGRVGWMRLAGVRSHGLFLVSFVGWRAERGEAGEAGVSGGSFCLPVSNSGTESVASDVLPTPRQEPLRQRSRLDACGESTESSGPRGVRGLIPLRPRAAACLPVPPSGPWYPNE